MILTALRRGRMHGYAINEWIETNSGRAIAVDEAALYPALHRLQLKDGSPGSGVPLSSTARQVLQADPRTAARSSITNPNAGAGSCWDRPAARSFVVVRTVMQSLWRTLSNRFSNVFRRDRPQLGTWKRNSQFPTG